MNEPWMSMMSDDQRKISCVSASHARSLLTYDKEVGSLTWNIDRSTRARKGDEAGLIQMGRYRRICIDGRYYMAHRLAWLIVTGEWPEHEIDHINGKTADNRWANLRAATTAENKRNTVHKNRSGLIGASWSSLKGMYRAQIRTNKGRIFLGWFTTAEEAHQAYVQAARVHHGEFTRC